MENWKDQGIVLHARSHGENGAIVSLLTENNGRHAGYVRGGKSTRNRGVLEVGNIVDVQWSSRLAENLGSYVLEPVTSNAALFMSDPLKLAALQSACALCDTALPEREGHPGLYHGFLALLDTLRGDVWAPAYIIWEIALLKELGFSLDFSKCAGGGDDKALAYVSPKTGRAVSHGAGEPYKDKLLPLPDFLKPQGGSMDEEEIIKGLKMNAYFLEHWVFVHNSGGIPHARTTFQLRFEEHFARNRETPTA